jgi:glycosyltransferase involved in cell wall biosynthesis
VPLGVDVYKEDFRERGKYRWRLSRKKPKKVIAFIGYASKAKGFDLFLDALQNLRDLSDHFEILVVSKHVESYKARLNEVAKNFSLQHIDGYERSQLVDLYNDIDLAVVPSIWKETFNQVSYEATMYGVPVVMSDSLGISAYMPPTLNFESNNYHQLAQKIRRCLEDQNYIDDYWDSDQFSLLSLKQHESIVNSVIKRIA